MTVLSRRRLFTLTAGLGAAGAVGILSSTPSWAADNNQTAWNFFIGKGLSKAQTAGLIGNFIVESGADPINPAAVQHGGGPGRGIAQWEGGRRSEMEAYARSRGVAWSNLQMQLDFVWKELTGKESRALTKIKETSTPATAAVAVRKYYERPSAHADQARINAAELVFSRNGGGGTPPPAGETSFPVLKSGASGAAVTTLQYLLRAQKQSIAVDGSFGPKTKAAVLALQKAKGLAQDGIVGPRTWVGVIVVVKSGSKGDAVKGLQTELKAHGHSVAVDGSFGPATKSAVTAYQKKEKLAVDGVVGPATWGSLVD